MAAGQQGNPVVELIQGLKGLLQNVQAVAMQAANDYQGFLNGNVGGDSISLAALQEDKVDPFEEEQGEGNRLVRHYENGTVRTENVTSGVIMEERPDGSLYVSLAEGRLLHQAAPGEPILAYDSNGARAPQLAQVSKVHLDAGQEPTVAMHFEDDLGVHFVEIESLRYFRLTRRA